MWIPERINEEILEVNANGLPKRISLEILERILESSLKEYKERFLKKRETDARGNHLRNPRKNALYGILDEKSK